MNLVDLNWLDWVVVAVLVLSGLDGTRRGLLMGGLDLVAAGAALLVAFIAERPAGNLLVALFPGFAPTLAHVVAFLGLLILVQIVIGATLGRGVAVVAQAIARGPLGGVDRLLGLVPGLLRGVVTVTLFLLPFALLPFAPVVAQAIESSTVANRLVSVALEVMPAVEAQLGQDLEGGLPSLMVAPPEAPPGGVERPLPIAPVGDLAPDPAAEQRMLELVNAERSRAGIKPLVADTRLRDVARGHSLEMFQLNYFSHISPTNGSPFDRLRAAGIPFAAAGENLAYAPNVEIAHQGLMNSSGHRANILRPEFGRVGIGVIHSPAQGSMFTQNFTN